MKKLIAFFLLVMLLLSISACSEKGYGREEIVKAAEPLLKESQILNEIYFGEGIPVKENGHQVGVYQEADISSFAQYGLTDIPSIRAKTADRRPQDPHLKNETSRSTRRQSSSGS